MLFPPHPPSRLLPALPPAGPLNWRLRWPSVSLLPPSCPAPAGSFGAGGLYRRPFFPPLPWERQVARVFAPTHVGSLRPAALGLSVAPPFRPLAVHAWSLGPRHPSGLAAIRWHALSLRLPPPPVLQARALAGALSLAAPCPLSPVPPCALFALVGPPLCSVILALLPIRRTGPVADPGVRPSWPCHLFWLPRCRLQPSRAQLPGRPRNSDITS